MISWQEGKKKNKFILDWHRKEKRKKNALRNIFQYLLTGPREKARLLKPTAMLRLANRAGCTIWGHSVPPQASDLCAPLQRRACGSRPTQASAWCSWPRSHWSASFSWYVRTALRHSEAPSQEMCEARKMQRKSDNGALPKRQGLFYRLFIVQ